MNEDPVRSMPADLSAERQVLGCCLLDDGITLARAVEAGITAGDFHSPHNRFVYQYLLDQKAAGNPVGMDGLLKDLEDPAKFTAAGGKENVDAIIGCAPTTLFAGRMIAAVREKSARRALITGATKLVEECYNGAEVPELMALAETVITPIALSHAAPSKAAAIQKLESRRVSLAKPEPEPVTRLFLAGKPVATPGNLMTLISRAKTGKTATIGGAVAAIIAAAGKITDFDTLGFTASNPGGKALVLFDTEQSPFDAYLCYKRACARVTPDPGIDPVDHPWVCPYSLVGYSVPELKSALHLGVDQAARRHHGVFAIILDGVADFVASVNDEAECNDFVTELRAMAVRFDCPVVCVIHSNEAIKAGDDGRGHLGKQLTRKAESNLLLKKVGEVTVITSEKQRKAPITEQDGVAFRWSEEEKRHVSCGAVRSARDVAKAEKLADMALATFEHLGKTSARYSEFVKAISEVRQVGLSRAEDRFSEMKKMGVISRDLMGSWSMGVKT